MRRLVGVLLAVAAATPAAAADVPAAGQTSTTSSDKRWEAVFDAEARYYSWTGSLAFPSTTSLKPGSGQLVYVPFGMALTGLPSDDWKLEIGIRSGYVNARQSSSEATGSLSTMTDTSLTGTVTYNGWNGIQPFLSLNTNLPSGTSALSPSQQGARMDPDLVGLGAFGEGFNVGVTGGAKIALSENALVGLGLGYTSRGAYERDFTGSSTLGGIGFGIGSFPLNLRLNPWDNITGNVSAAYQVGGLTLQASGSLAFETESSLNGAPFYQSGNRYTLEGSAVYAWANAGTTTLNGLWTHTNKNKVRVDLPTLVEEAFDSNSDIYQMTLEHRFKVANLSFGPSGGYLFRNANSWDPLTNQFVSRKRRWSAGGVIEYSATDQLSLKARVERVWIWEDPFPAFATPSTTSLGWLVSLGGTRTF